MGINCATQKNLLRGNCYESNLALCCNKGPNQKSQKAIAKADLNNGDQWSEKILGFDHSSTISNEHYEQDLIKLAGEKKNDLQDAVMSPNVANYDDDLASISNSSCYFESNCELYYIENGMGMAMGAQDLGEMTFNKNQSPRIITQKKKPQRKVKELQKVQQIDDHYKISYKYIDILGNGAFGTVRICSKVSKDGPTVNKFRDGTTKKAIESQIVSQKKEKEKRYAIKIMDKQLIDNSKTYQTLLKNELEILRECRHPKIMKTYDLMEDQQFYYVISELINGSSVMNRLKQQGYPFSESQTFVIIKQVMQALQYLHSRNIAHRDLKLENILFVSPDTKNLKLKLIDFGFAQKFDREKGMSLILGSPLYMAPELVKRTPGYTDKVDIWALGCITYLLLSGQTPFQSHTVQKIHRNTLSKQVTFYGTYWNKVSKECKDFILSCLERDQTRRQSISELLESHPWVKMYENDPTLSKEISPEQAALLERKNFEANQVQKPQSQERQRERGHSAQNQRESTNQKSRTAGKRKEQEQQQNVENSMVHMIAAAEQQQIQNEGGEQQQQLYYQHDQQNYYQGEDHQ